MAFDDLWLLLVQSLYASLAVTNVMVPFDLNASCSKLSLRSMACILFNSVKGGAMDRKNGPSTRGPELETVISVH